MFQGSKHKGILVLTLSLCLSLANQVKANDDLDLEAIEAEMSRRGEEQATQAPPEPAPMPEEVQTPKITFKDLSKLSSFDDITVIQKKFMPKTHRFQLFGGANFLTNNPFFDSYGVNGRLAFYLNEMWGLELSFARYSPSRRTITADLDSKHNITTKTMLSSNGYLGASLVFVPFYGKFTLLDRSIIPYDFYFSLGGGVTETSYTDKSAPSIHIGLGEIFSITKSFAWRWDLSHITYTARVPDSNTSGTLQDSGKKQALSDLYLGLGLTFLFPGVSYR